ncbi:MAG: hypothetical protein NZT92_19385, partial [Abditibacteriales bacterium]|nr:hypothetical protein [Abditibacteriales bacterium]MDW8367909.1 two-component regulator propeller domain-containing protein [Abditibacteriales bacterium]
MRNKPLRRRGLAVTIALWLLTSQAEAHTELLGWWHFTTQDGLPGTYVIADLHAAGDGRLWCATQGGGVACFDGYGWRVHRQSRGGLSDNYVRRIHERPDGTLWFATRSGVSVYHLGREKWVTQEYPSLRFLSRKWVTDIAEQPTGTLWLATADDGVYRYNLAHVNSPLHHLTLSGGVPRERNSIESLFVQSNGALWICSIDGSVRVIEPDGTMNPLVDRRAPKVMRAREWKDGSIGIVNDGGGIRIYDGRLPPERRWTSPDLQKLLTGVDATRLIYLNDLMEASNGDRWLATNGHGILIVDAAGKLVRHITKQNSGLLSDRVYALCQRSDGTVWISTRLGMNVYAPHLLQRAPRTQKAGRHWSVDRAAKQILIQDAARRTMKTLPLLAALEDATLEDVMEDSSGTVWVGTDRKGLYSYRDRRGWRQETMGDERRMGQTGVLSICETKRGTLWFGTKNGLVRRQGDRWQTFNVDNTGGGLPANVVQELTTLPDGRLVAGTTNGIAFYDEQADAWSALTAHNGFIDASCGGLEVLADGKLRVHMSSPHDDFDLTQPPPPETFLMVGNTVLMQDARGQMQTYRLQFQPSPQSQTIARHHLVPRRDRGLAGPLLLRGTRLTVQAFALTPWRGASDEFQYQFEIDGKRFPWQRENFRVFDNLSKGNHTVRVRACDRFLNIDPTPVTLTLRVQPPLPSWVTWTMGSGLIFTLFALIWGLATRQQRIERVRMEHELKVGHDIQTSLLPREQMKHGEYEIVSRYLPATEVGGDFYDVFPLSEDKVGLIIGDVSGKGVGGAMYMSVALTLTEAIGR